MYLWQSSYTRVKQKEHYQLEESCGEKLQQEVDKFLCSQDQCYTWVELKYQWTQSQCLQLLLYSAQLLQSSSTMQIQNYLTICKHIKEERLKQNKRRRTSTDKAWMVWSFSEGTRNSCYFDHCFCHDLGYYVLFFSCLFFIGDYVVIFVTQTKSET